MDIKTVFLYEYIEEEVYMEQVTNFVFKKYSNRVYKLNKVLYDLK